MISPFKNNERVCFVGDSITALTSWISHIADFYARKMPSEKVSIFPCGIAGGSCVSAMAYYQQQTVIWSPNTVVIMLGMNDIDRAMYGENRTDSMIKTAERAIERYEHNLSSLSDIIKSQYKVGRIIYLAPTPYDELRACDTENLIGCQAALRRCADICKKTAELYGGEFYDLGGEMFDVLQRARGLGSQNELISLDRVHPTEAGFCVMARLFLSAQGFDDMAVTAEDIVSGRSMLHRSDAAQRYHDAAATLQERWTAERLIAIFAPDQSEESKFKYAEEYSRLTDNKGIYKYSADNYKKFVLDEPINRECLRRAVEALYE